MRQAGGKRKRQAAVLGGGGATLPPPPPPPPPWRRPSPARPRVSIASAVSAAPKPAADEAPQGTAGIRPATPTQTIRLAAPKATGAARSPLQEVQASSADTPPWRAKVATAATLIKACGDVGAAGAGGGARAAGVKGAVSSNGWSPGDAAVAVTAARRAKAKPTLLKSFQRVFLEAPGTLTPADREAIMEARQLLEVTIEGGGVEADYAPIATFEDLQVLPPYAREALAEMCFGTPMPIQAQALPILLGGHDLIGIARTGSGKTLAYLLPAVVHIEAQAPVPWGVLPVTPVALVLAPTRELVVQISEEAGKLLNRSGKSDKRGGNHKGGIWAACVFGGCKRCDQLKQLQDGCHVLAATPGRLTDYISTDELSLERVTYFVLDEADRMLEEGFQAEVLSCSESIRRDRQMCFFSATWPREVQALARRLCQGGQPIRIAVGQREDGAATARADIMQEVDVFDQPTWEQREAAKKQRLYRHLRELLPYPTNKILVFVSDRNLADELSWALATEGFATESMHGGRKQWERLEVLTKFKRSEVRLLVATDVMGRGLDIPNITHVVIYDMGDVDDYIHRVGRTARGAHGAAGHALTLFEYNQKWPELAGGLIRVLEESSQAVPDELLQIAQEVENGQRKIVWRNDFKPKRRLNWTSSSWTGDGAGSERPTPAPSWQPASSYD